MVSTSTSAWTDVPGMTVGPICAAGGVSATLSVNLKGAQAGFRVQVDSGATMRPGPAYWHATTDSNAFSFTFVSLVGEFEGSASHAFNLQWRAPSGTAQMLRGDLRLIYLDPGTCGE